MLYIFLIYFIILIIGTKYNKSFNKEYLNKKNTTIVNGLFIIIVFFSHFRQYITVNTSTDIYFYKVIDWIGQLMVTTFFFFSGYGIYESIKNKKDYIKNFFKKRFVPTYTNWLIALLLFLILNIILKKELTLSKIILSIVGWDSMGNSNWFMFDTFIIYIFIIISFKIYKNRKSQIIGVTLMTSILVGILYFYKDPYWYNTVLCFPLGMWYSYHKDRIDSYVFNNKRYYILLLSTAFVSIFLIYIYMNIRSSSFIYIVAAFTFVLFITFLMMKLNFNSKIFTWIGTNLFWVYILQRLPMIALQSRISNMYIYIILCMIITFILIEIITSIKKRIKLK